MTEKLWAIYVPGPDEYYAAPDEKSAIEMVDKHNAEMRKYIEKNKPNWSDLHTDCEVAEWPFSEEEHSAEMLEFDYEGWGMKRNFE